MNKAKVSRFSQLDFIDSNICYFSLINQALLQNQETPNIVCSFDNIRYNFNLSMDVKDSKNTIMKNQPSAQNIFNQIEHPNNNWLFWVFINIIGIQLWSKYKNERAKRAMLYTKQIVKDGQIVTIDQVKDLNIIHQIVIILDIANQEQMSKLISHIEFKKTLEQFKTQQINLVAIFHLSHDIQEEYYIYFIKNIPISTIFSVTIIRKVMIRFVKHIQKSNLYQNIYQIFCIKKYPLNFPRIECLKLKNLNKCLATFLFLNIQFSQLNNRVQTCQNFYNSKTINNNFNKKESIISNQYVRYKKTKILFALIVEKELLNRFAMKIQFLMINHKLFGQAMLIVIIIEGYYKLFIIQEILGEQYNWIIIVSKQFDQDFKEDINQLKKIIFINIKLEYQIFIKNYEGFTCCLKDQFELDSIKFTRVEHCPNSMEQDQIYLMEDLYLVLEIQDHEKDLLNSHKMLMFQFMNPLLHMIYRRMQFKICTLQILRLLKYACLLMQKLLHQLIILRDIQDRQKLIKRFQTMRELYFVETILEDIQMSIDYLIIQK
ncbi:unnamed protein product [Paramecium octaurelia]|uniref:Uncharacterized protein n=1 Tax=Paramecium octaurelia TaxID=43137 RepID=A0A8S1YR62_PAROT|nr:unnamed protein product [Paramecium octaurelia]